MADEPRHTGPRPTGADGEVPTPRWVYGVGIAIVALALAFVAMHLSSGGIPAHGPR